MNNLKIWQTRGPVSHNYQNKLMFLLLNQTYCASCHISLGSSVIRLSLMSRCVRACNIHVWCGTNARLLLHMRRTRIVNAPTACCARVEPRDALPPPLRSSTLGGCVLWVPYEKYQSIENQSYSTDDNFSASLLYW